ncbi:MAG: bifunctional 4-hydroxy-2-oxoglutarate aldolase/2-dehydro-3-deoxy-phosphogluconate aldolase [Candidatus Lokiarchaeota archaeon]|nr:bifunctional 4-hydroxy-2-oxoglutarate aldolase/2-dehydro-3-deoxy-phosphogluconate aldolase [Candidatus Lokiarchaeota archaeon]
MQMSALVQDLKRCKLVAVVEIGDAASAVPLAHSLLEGGVHYIEITFRTEGAGDALLALKGAGTGLHYGAGTVRTKEQASRAIRAGAEFLVSPGFNEGVVAVAIDAGLPFIPGVDSTLGIEAAVGMGLDTLKFFPAEESGGIKWLKAVQGPYPELRFIPTGGISLANLKDYLAAPNVLAVGGSFLAPKQLIKEQRFGDITAACSKASGVVKELKQ